MIEFSQEAKRRYNAIVSHYPEKRAALIPVLHLAQREFGWISQEVADYVGELMDYPPSDVLSVATFYTLLHKKPAGKYHMEVCRNVSCWLMGAYRCVDEIKSLLRIDVGGMTEDGRFSLNLTECLGSCGTAPAMQVGDRYYENLTPQSLAEIIEKLKND
ncbi:MAG: NADH-quinone oxidoreductase subunit NuoE [Blastocatellia bacterium AA13]|nr:MAG: NADH-quinone oxidoreductase subunit NuoE [Blastocatellia bacterium AA13]